MRTVHQRGLASVGLREITMTAGVAQGSLTNHFASKEAFGVAVIDHYFDQIRGVIAATLARNDGLLVLAALGLVFLWDRWRAWRLNRAGAATRPVSVFQGFMA